MEHKQINYEFWVIKYNISRNNPGVRDKEVWDVAVILLTLDCLGQTIMGIRLFVKKVYVIHGF